MTSIPSKTLSNGFTLPVYGYGTWEVGGRSTRDVSNDDTRDINAIKRAIDAGVTHIDTAQMYAAGHAETLVGEAIKGQQRETLTLVTKSLPSNMTADRLRSSLTESLDRLGTSYVDVYMLHRYNSDIPLDETMGAMDELIDEGLVRHPAVSNFTVDRFREAQKVSRHKIVANQVHYNVQVREAEAAGLVNFSRDEDALLIAWRPVQKGGLDLAAPIIIELAEKYDKTPTQIAINWLVSQPNVVTLALTRSPEHLAENIDACGWTMESADVERIRGEMPDQQTVSDAVPLDYE